MKKIFFYTLIIFYPFFNLAFGQIKSPKEIIDEANAIFGGDLKDNVSTIQYESYSAKDIWGNFVKQENIRSITCDLDNKNRLIRYRGILNSDSIETNAFLSYISEENNFLISYDIINQKGNNNASISWKYDSLGNTIEAIEKINEKILKKDIFIYNSQNKLIEKRCYNEGGTLAIRILFKYDSKGKEVERIENHNDGSFIKSEKKYNSANKLINESFYIDGKFIYRKEYKYDKSGREIINMNSIEKSAIKFEYDNHKNWTKKIEPIYQKNEAIPVAYEITVRKITYRTN